MTINSIKELKALIRLCRSEGIKGITVDNITIELGSKPYKQSKSNTPIAPEADIRVPMFNGAVASIETADVITTDELSEEQLLMWSANASAEGRQ